MQSTLTDVRQQVSRLIEGLCQGLYERETPMKLALLSAIAGESIFLLGPPGVGKSLIARRLKFAFRDGTSFEYLMSRFSTPDEIFGPVSIKKLKEEDKYERLTDRYLPGANIVFLDEIWKSGPAIQNALLTILNEKVYRNGEQEVRVDLKGIVTASNELPPDKESFQPLWDRFLLRYQMLGIRENRNFLRMITDTQDVYADQLAEEEKITAAEMDRWDQDINAIELPPEVLNTIQVIRHKLEEQNQRTAGTGGPVKVYDRRWKKIVRLLRTSAFLNGRQQVDLMDCFLIVHCLWGHPDQLEAIQEVVSETIRKHGYSIAINLGMIRKEIEAFEQEVEEEIKIKQVKAEDRLQPVQDKYYAFVQAEKQFQGTLISIEDFKSLAMDELKVINIYDDTQTLRHRLKAKRSLREHAIDIVYNSEEASYPLQTHKVERTEVLYKKPHPLVEAHWQQRFEQLDRYIREQQQRVGDDAPAELQHLRSNLFVEARLSEIVEANMKEVAAALDKLHLRLEKLQYSYQHVGG
jgi:MoxR-like ATPase